MSEIKVDTVGPRVDNGTLTIGAAGDTVNIAGTAGTGFPAGTTINTNADNRVITGSGTAGTLNGETNLTFDGTNLDLPDDKKIRLGTGNDTEIYHDSTSGHTFIRETGSGSLILRTNNFVVQNAAGTQNIINAPEGASGTDFSYNGSTKLSIENTGVNVTGNVIVGTSGKGIDFSATSGTGTSEILDDYEEGSFNPSWSVQGGGSLGNAPATNQGFYTKVGRACTISIMSYILATSGTISSYTCTNLPFQSAPNTVAPSMGQEFGQTGNGMLCVNAQDDSTVVIKKYDGNAPPANAYMRVCFTYQTV